MTAEPSGSKEDLEQVDLKKVNEIVQSTYSAYGAAGLVTADVTRTLAEKQSRLKTFAENLKAYLYLLDTYFHLIRKNTLYFNQLACVTALEVMDRQFKACMAFKDIIRFSEFAPLYGFTPVGDKCTCLLCNVLYSGFNSTICHVDQVILLPELHGFADLGREDKDHVSVLVSTQMLSLCDRMYNIMQQHMEGKLLIYFAGFCASKKCNLLQVVIPEGSDFADIVPLLSATQCDCGYCKLLMQAMVAADHRFILNSDSLTTRCHAQIIGRVSGIAEGDIELYEACCRAPSFGVHCSSSCHLLQVAEWTYVCHLASRANQHNSFRNVLLTGTCLALEKKRFNAFNRKLVSGRKSYFIVKVLPFARLFEAKQFACSFFGLSVL